ncbi:CysS/YqeB C-terminal domain-containing protein [Microtetraspora niveoalba]|uniref:CysS/YqeB C-terminal domain-containing protein n=1 Tax=Microtetraspora niveoalba TaxID=46175 RepID=UPI0008297ABD|nr:hypothetical protein [Microtetraspora niveoalba]
MPVRPGLLVLMGSGETSPTMVEVHRAAARGLGLDPWAVLLDTPYAFQENAPDVTARARRYFSRSVGLEVQVESAGVHLAEPDWVFCGPGSPTYALDRWTASTAAAELRARVRSRAGVTVLASAAACTAGLATVPVYEIYKVGAEPHWRDGLDLLGELGLRVAVVPHYDNTEGGTHDTRFCYLGERRLSGMEAALPAGAAVLGIDEHTAVVFDLGTGEVRVSGRGGLTVRRRGAQTVLPSGSSLSLDTLRGLADGVLGLAEPAARPGTGGADGAGRARVRLPGSGRGDGPERVPGFGTADEPGSGTADVPGFGTADVPATLADVTGDCLRRFESALGEGDAGLAAGALLALEEEIVKWSADTEEDEGGVDQAREVLRRLITRFGRVADVRAPRDRLAPLVTPLLELRARLRERGGYETADALRAALASGGVAVRDTPDGSEWTADTHRPDTGQGDAGRAEAASGPGQRADAGQGDAGQGDGGGTSTRT